MSCHRRFRRSGVAVRQPRGPAGNRRGGDLLRWERPHNRLGTNYVGIGGATSDGDQVVLFIEIEVFQGVFSVGNQRLELVDVLVDPATIVGTLESRQEATFANVPPLIQEDGRAQRGGC
ncbi:MAG: hypothetical protein IIB60_03295 [Planctomycetes bacterium]|nr:hypothetical protein [Planctomycetota bacterium]